MSGLSMYASVCADRRTSKVLDNKQDNVDAIFHIFLYEIQHVFELSMLMLTGRQHFDVDAFDK